MRIALGSALLLACAPALAAERGRLVSVRAAATKDASVVELIGERPLSFTTLRLSEPPRVVVDVVDVDPGGIAPEQRVDDGTVRRIGVAAAGGNTARVVIELSEEAEFDVRAAGTRLEVRIARAVTAAAPPLAAAAAGEDVLHEVDRARAEIPTVSLVGAPRPPPPEPPPARIARAGQRTSITGIGFRPLDGGSVVVRSDGPLDYGVSGEERAVLLQFRDAVIPLANNRRPIDTRVFGGPVARVVPLQAKGGAGVRIELVSRAEYHLQQSGGVLTVSFTPPAN